jgi:hypothetical protein
MPPLLDQAAALTFGSLARLRGDRALHPDGVVFAGTVVATTTLVAAPGAYRALIRLSRGGGLPDTLPDVRGVAIRIHDACGEGRDQDVLLASSLSPPVGRHLLVPGREFGAGAFYSSLLPYRAQGRALLLGTRICARAGTTLGEVADTVRGRGLRLPLLAAAPLGAWEEVGHVELEEIAPCRQDLRFNPWVSGGALEPAGVLMRLRDPAYRASQAASVK